ncbi:uncharacterized protein LOC117298456 [Asterias rubens]|uniref:uncharacterized protein LOC117298456 n=1 Tax=Asterias rubens TaxID=7604 RepID=UPI0014553C18|nr:uncharacterized protein LOC117298456 [Asterias rubens]
MAMRTVLYALLLSLVACAFSLAAPAAESRLSTNTNSPRKGSGSKLLYGDAVDVVEKMHGFLSTLTKFEEVKAGEGAREDEMIRYGIPARTKKENVGFQMPGWRRRRRRSTVEDDLVSAAYFDRLDDQADAMVNSINKLMDDLQKVRQYYEGKNAYRESRQFHLPGSRDLSPADNQLPSQE